MTTFYTKDDALQAVIDESRHLVAHKGERSRAAMSKYGLWGIWNKQEEVVVPEGYDYDYVCWYDHDATSYRANELVEYLAEEEPSMLEDIVLDTYFNGENCSHDDMPFEDAYAWIMSRDNEKSRYDGKSERDRTTEIVAGIAGPYLEYDEQHIHEIWGLEPDRLFLTEEDAQAHLKENYYHYAKGAHPFCIGIWRSPHMHRLLDGLLALGDDAYDPGYAQKKIDFDTAATAAAATDREKSVARTRPDSY